MKNFVLSANDMWEFNKKLQKQLDEGWKIVPNTLKIGGSIIVTEYDSRSNLISRVFTPYIVVLEKE